MNGSLYIHQYGRGLKSKFTFDAVVFDGGVSVGGATVTVSFAPVRLIPSTSKTLCVNGNYAYCVSWLGLVREVRWYGSGLEPTRDQT